MFSIIPAIDLKDGRCVRLRQGRAEAATIYSDDPITVAKRWVAEGATYLHVVDLDGAFQGRPVQTHLIARIAQEAGAPVEAGGGLRTVGDIKALLDAGVDRVVLGTGAVNSPKQMRVLADKFGTRLAVAIDACAGVVQVQGWVASSKVRAVDLAVEMERAGVTTLIYTDTTVDGTMAGPNLRGVTEICSAVSCAVVAAGGIAAAEDVRNLRKLGADNLVGAIVGKALYDGKVTLRELLGATA